jgi:hypothetical protein
LGTQSSNLIFCWFEGDMYLRIKETLKLATMSQGRELATFENHFKVFGVGILTEAKYEKKLRLLHISSTVNRNNLCNFPATNVCIPGKMFSFYVHERGTSI